MYRDIFNLIEGFRFKYILSIVVSFFEGLLAAVSLTALIPLVSVVITDDLNFSWPFTIFPQEFYSIQNVLIFISIGLIFKVIFSFLSVFIFSQLKYQLWNNWSDLLSKDHIKNSIDNEGNTSKEGPFFSLLTREIIQATSLVSGSATFLSLLLSFILMLVAMILINPYVTFISLALIAIIYFAFIRFLNRYINVLGARGVKFAKSTAQSISDSLTNLVDIKSLSEESFSLKKIKLAVKDFSFNDFISSLILFIPKNLFEMILGVSILFFSIFVISDLPKELIIDSLPEIIFFIAGISRLMSVYSSLATIDAKNQKRLPSLMLLKSKILNLKQIKLIEKSQIHKTENLDPNNDNLLILENLNLELGGSKILDDLSLEIRKGDFIRVNGVSGSGKTTFVKVLSGLISGFSGLIKLPNNTILSDYVRFVPQEPNLIRGSIYENLILDSEYSDEEISNVLNVTGLGNLARNSSGDFLQTNAFNLSVGQKCRLAIARALLKKPKVIILDESLDKVEIEVAEDIINNLKKTKITLIVISHREMKKSLFNKIYVLTSGKLVNQK